MDTIPLSDYQPRCLANHCGIWMMEPRRFEQAIGLYRAGQLPQRQLEQPADNVSRDRVPYLARSGDIGVIRINGSLMKGESKFGGTSTLGIRRALRAATVSEHIGGIMVHIDESPGGHASGTAELADEILRAAAAKPLRVHADDLVASAAYWPAAQAPVGALTINAMGEAGSIGAFAIVRDVSKAMEDDGIVTHVVKSAAHKGDFAPGTPITPEQLARLQRDIDRLHEAFVSAVMAGRHLTREQVDAVATGDTFPAEEALQMGLVDGIMSFEDALATLRDEVASQRDERQRTRRNRQQKQRLAVAKAKTF